MVDNSDKLRLDRSSWNLSMPSFTAISASVFNNAQIIIGYNKITNIWINLFVTDEQERVQKKTFVNWINSCLSKVSLFCYSHFFAVIDNNLIRNYYRLSFFHRCATYNLSIKAALILFYCKKSWAHNQVVVVVRE